MFPDFNLFPDVTFNILKQYPDFKSRSSVLLCFSDVFQNNYTLCCETGIFLLFVVNRALIYSLYVFFILN